MKKLLTFAFALMLFAGFSGGAHAAFSDVGASHPNREAIDYVESKGYVSGFPDGTFRPDLGLNRAELTKILVELKFDDNEIDGCLASYTQPHWTYVFFPDVAVGAWYDKYICLAKTFEMVAGFPDGSFKPGDPISLTEAAKIVVEAFDIVTGNDDVWYKPYIMTMENFSALPTSLKDFGQKLTRGELAEMIHRMENPELGKATTSYSAILNKVEVASDPAPSPTPSTDVPASTPELTPPTDDLIATTTSDALDAPRSPIPSDFSVPAWAQAAGFNMPAGYIVDIEKSFQTSEAVEGYDSLYLEMVGFDLELAKADADVIKAGVKDSTDYVYSIATISIDHVVTLTVMLVDKAQATAASDGGKNLLAVEFEIPFGGATMSDPLVSDNETVVETSEPAAEPAAPANLDVTYADANTGLPGWAKIVGLNNPKDMTFKPDVSFTTSKDVEGYNSVYFVYESEDFEALKAEALRIAESARIDKVADFAFSYFDESMVVSYKTGLLNHYADGHGHQIEIRGEKGDDISTLYLKAVELESMNQASNYGEIELGIMEVMSVQVTDPDMADFDGLPQWLLDLGLVNPNDKLLIAKGGSTYDPEAEFINLVYTGEYRHAKTEAERIANLVGVGLNENPTDFLSELIAGTIVYGGEDAKVGPNSEYSVQVLSAPGDQNINGILSITVTKG